MKFFLLIFKSLRRNVLRTTLTSLAIMVLVLVVTLVWTVLWFLDTITAEKSEDFKAIVTERWQLPSQMPFSYAVTLSEGAPREEGDIKVEDKDSMTWQFYGGTLDPERLTRESMVFFFGMDPYKIRNMMDEGKSFDPALIEKLAQTKNGAIIGRERLELLNKRVGERFTLTSLNYKGINLEFEIVGQCPEGRYNLSAFMNRQYLLDALDAYQRDKGQPHPMHEKTLNLVWLKLPDTETYKQVSGQIMDSPLYTSPAVKMETMSSGLTAFLDAYRDLLWGMRWLLVPAVLVTMTLVIANAISISVRERRTEMAVLKVIGFRPGQLLFLILGEAVFIGASSGLISAGATYMLINNVMGGVKFPIAFFPAFYVPINALWWGVAIGSLTGLAGSFFPAWSARSVKVAAVFAKVA